VQDSVGARDLGSSSHEDLADRINSRSEIDPPTHTQMHARTRRESQGDTSPPRHAALPDTSPGHESVSASPLIRAVSLPMIEAGSSEAIGSITEPVATLEIEIVAAPRTRLQHGICKPKKFGNDFVCLMSVTGEPRDYDEASKQEWRNAIDIEY
jgi:hypothetical protein